MKHDKIKCIKNTLPLFALLALPLIVPAQVPTALGVVHSATSASVSPGSFSIADIAEIENRAKIFKGRLFRATGEIYSAVTNRDLAGKTPQEAAEILAGPTVGKGVRGVVSVVDVDRPVAVAPDPKKGLNIAAITLTPAAALRVNSINATAYVSVPNLRLVRK